MAEYPFTPCSNTENGVQRLSEKYSPVLLCDVTGHISAGDGLILSSFQVLEHRDDVTKAGHDLDHFLHPYGQVDRSEWKAPDIQHMECQAEAPHQASLLPDIHALNSSGHTVPSFLSDFQSEAMSDAARADSHAGELLAAGGSRLAEEGGSAGPDAGDKAGVDESCEPCVDHTLHQMGQEMHQTKTDSFDDLEVETPDLLTSHKQGFIEMEPGLTDHGFMDPASSSDNWPQGMGHARPGSTHVSEWRREEKEDGDSVTHLDEPEVDKSWEFLRANQQHSTQSLQLHHQWMPSGDSKLAEVEMTSQHCQETPWGSDAKMISRSSNEGLFSKAWEDKTLSRPQSQAEGSPGLLASAEVGSPSSHSHWSKPGQAVASDGISWMQDVGAAYPMASEVNSVCKLFHMPSTNAGGNAPAASTITTFAELQPANSCIAQWPPLESQVLPTMHNAFPGRAGPGQDTVACRRTPAPSCLRSMASHGCHRNHGAGGGGPEAWPRQAHTPSPIHPTAPLAGCVDPAPALPPGPMCSAPGLGGKRTKAVVSRRSGVTVTPATMAQSGDVAKARPLLDQARKQAHPYMVKDSKKSMRDVFPGTGANVHTLKASHIVSWYIDYLIHENEHLTQISRAFSLPVNLFHSDDFYFMESVKKKVHFPSIKFLSWMQQNLPSINVNAVDFHEGRPPVVSVWNQDWFWQNKSRRDIIHDVFFYFQHRRVTCAI